MHAVRSYTTHYTRKHVHTYTRIIRTHSPFAGWLDLLQSIPHRQTVNIVIYIFIFFAFVTYSQYHNVCSVRMYYTWCVWRMTIMCMLYVCVCVGCSLYIDRCPPVRSAHQHCFFFCCSFASRMWNVRWHECENLASTHHSFVECDQFRIGISNQIAYTIYLVDIYFFFLLVLCWQLIFDLIILLLGSNWFYRDLWVMFCCDSGWRACVARQSIHVTRSMLLLPDLVHALNLQCAFIYLRVVCIQ